VELALVVRGYEVEEVTLVFVAPASTVLPVLLVLTGAEVIDSVSIKEVNGSTSSN
jgi:hypothetical protein